MSAASVLRAAVAAHLADTARVFDAPPARASMPQAVIEDPVLAAADAAGVTGRTGTIALRYADVGERPQRLRMLAATIEAAMERLPADLGGEGWRLAALRLARSRVARGSGERWLGSSEFAVRMYRSN